MAQSRPHERRRRPDRRRRTAWARNLAAPIRGFMNAEIGGAVVLAAAAVTALLWANIDERSYTSVWETHLTIALGTTRSGRTCAAGSTRA